MVTIFDLTDHEIIWYFIDMTKRGRPAKGREATKIMLDLDIKDWLNSKNINISDLSNELLRGRMNSQHENGCERCHGEGAIGSIAEESAQHLEGFLLEALRPKRVRQYLKERMQSLEDGERALVDLISKDLKSKGIDLSNKPDAVEAIRSEARQAVIALKHKEETEIIIPIRMFDEPGQRYWTRTFRRDQLKELIKKYIRKEKRPDINQETREEEWG